MSYRKITVDNQQYEYTVGKEYTKVKGLGIYKNSDIGDSVATGYKYHPEKFIVAPYNVANAIKGIKKPREMHKCRHGTETHLTTLSPYDLEIYHEEVQMINCPKCVEQSAGDI